jgi:peptidoglycan/LPS O-acetylase OafA/YrhL
LNRVIKSQFFPALESLRGIASLSVVIGHSYVFTLPIVMATVSQPGFNLAHSVVGAIFDPQPAVLLFFVLSGFVLGIQLDRDPVSSASSYVAYLVRRAFRLMPMMWVSFVFAFLLFLASALFDSASKNQIAEQFGFFRKSFFLQDFNLNLVVWTLYVEIICSAVLPLFFLVVGRASVVVNAIILASLLVASILVRSHLTAQFFVFFYAGLLVGCAPERLSRFAKGNAGLLLWISSIAIYFGAKYLIPGRMDWLYGSWQRWQWAEVGACALIVYFVAIQRFPSVQSLLTKSSTRFLGRISFSLYLLHLPVIYFLVKVMSQFGLAVTATTTTFERSFYFVVLAGVTSAISIPLSALTYRRIERPAADIGRHFASLIGKVRAPTKSFPTLGLESE